MPNKNDVPLIVLKLKGGVFLLTAFIVGVTAVVLPIRIWRYISGNVDYNAGQLVILGNSIGIFLAALYGVLFFVSLVVLACCVSRVGNVSFYSDRLEIKTFLPGLNKVRFYKDAYVLIGKNMLGPTISIMESEFPPSFWHPWQRYKWRYIDSIYITITNNTMKNPEMGELAIDILSKNAMKFSTE